MRPSLKRRGQSQGLDGGTGRVIFRVIGVYLARREEAEGVRISCRTCFGGRLDIRLVCRLVGCVWRGVMSHSRC